MAACLKPLYLVGIFVAACFGMRSVDAMRQQKGSKSLLGNADTAAQEGASLINTIKCVGDGNENGWVDDYFWCSDSQSSASKLQCEREEAGLSYEERKLNNMTRCKWSPWTFQSYCKCGTGRRWCTKPGASLSDGTCSFCNEKGTVGFGPENDCICRDSSFPGPNCGCKVDEDCPEQQACANNGQCMSPCEKKNHDEPDKLPKTRCYASKDEFLSDHFCKTQPGSNSNLMPKHLQGLFWMKNVSLPDIAFCTSTGRWYNESFGSLQIGDLDWVYLDNREGWKLGEASWNHRNVQYLIKLLDEEQLDASIGFVGNGFGNQILASLFNGLFVVGGMKFYLKEMSNGTGYRWSRPSYIWEYFLSHDSVDGLLAEVGEDEYKELTDRLYNTSLNNSKTARAVVEKLEEKLRHVKGKFQASKYYEAWKLYLEGETEADGVRLLDENVQVFKSDEIEEHTRYFRHLHEYEYEGKVLDNRGWPVVITY